VATAVGIARITRKTTANHAAVMFWHTGKDNAQSRPVAPGAGSASVKRIAGLTCQEHPQRQSNKRSKKPQPPQRDGQPENTLIPTLQPLAHTR